MTALRKAEAPLRATIDSIFRAAGCAPAEAAAIANHLVDANLAGHDSHGIGMVPEYVRAIREKRMTLNGHVRVVSDTGAVLVLDAGRAAGQVAGAEAMDLGIQRARTNGAVVVALRQSHHLGRIGAYAERCLAAGIASVHFVNVIGHRPLVAPFGGSDVRLGTNPFCAGIPRKGGAPLVLDMATSRVAYGKVRVARNAGHRVAPGTLIDGQGRPTDDPAVMVPDVKGALLPMGEHKGSGLALLCDILAGAFTLGGTNHAGAFDDDMIINNMFSVLLDPDAFGDGMRLAGEIEKAVAWVKASPPAPGTDAVLVAGEPELARRAERRAEGIPVDTETWAQIAAAAATLGVTVA